MNTDREFLEMALAGYALKRADLEREIERVRLLLALESDQTHAHGGFGAVPVSRKQGANSETRAKMAAAQRKRWARVKREKARKGGRG